MAVEPPSVAQTLSILRGLRGRYEQFHGVTITEGALVAAASLSNRYIAGRQLPDKAIDCIDEATAQVGDCCCVLFLGGGLGGGRLERRSSTWRR